MLYPAFITFGDRRHAHTVQFPDFPGCLAAADEVEDLGVAVQEAVQAHFHGEPSAVPAPTPLPVLVKRGGYSGGTWALVDIDLTRIEAPAKSVRVNITLPENVLQRIDRRAEALGMTRSGYIARLANQGTPANAARSRAETPE